MAEATYGIAGSTGRPANLSASRDQFEEGLAEDAVRAIAPIKITRKRLFRQVFELFTTTALTYPDCYHAALVERSIDRRVISFDKGFDRLATLERVEP